MILAAVAIALTPPLIIRRGQVDITPPESLPLGGYTERHDKMMQPGGNPLYARCTEIEQGSTKVAVVSVEMLTIPESLYREVSKRIPSDLHLFMQASHTHCAPDSQMLNDRMTFKIPGIAGYRKRWLTWYADKIASSVTLALAAPKREVDKVLGTILPVDANRPRREGGKPDKRFVRIYDVARQNPPRAGADEEPLFFYYTAHPTIFDENREQTSGDWIGKMMARDHTIVLNGAIGDVSPAADGPDPDAKFKAFCDKFARADSNVKPRRLNFWPSGKKGLSWESEAIKLDPKKPHPTFAKKYGIPEALASTLVDQFAPPSDSISAIRLGSLAIVGVPGEPSSILGNEIIAAGNKMGFKCVLVCSHVDGWMGYILDPKDYDRGGYEAELSFYGREEGQKVVDAAVGALKKLKGR